MKLEAIDHLEDGKAKVILRQLLEKATSPAFGVLPQRELNLLLFEALRDAGVVRPEASLYSLMTDLKITRARARNLLFDLEIRETSGKELDAQARLALARPKGFVLDGSYLVLGIENPLVQAHIKDRVTQLGHLTDASFDATLIRIKPAALGALVENLMDDADRAAFRQGMIEAGLEKSKSLSSAIAYGLKALATKYIGEEAAEYGAGYLEELGAFITPRAQGAIARVVDILRGLVSGSPSPQPPEDPRPQIRGL